MVEFNFRKFLTENYFCNLYTRISTIYTRTVSANVVRVVKVVHRHQPPSLEDSLWMLCVIASEQRSVESKQNVSHQASKELLRHCKGHFMRILICFNSIFFSDLSESLMCLKILYCVLHVMFHIVFESFKI